MIEIKGRVIAIASDHARVAIEQDEHCASCGARGACHGSTPAQVIDVCLDSGMQVGDQISLGMSEATVARSAILAYLVPPVCLVACAGLTNSLFHSDGMSILGAALGLVLGLGVVRYMTRFFGPGSLEPCISHCPAPTSFPNRSSAP